MLHRSPILGRYRAAPPSPGAGCCRQPAVQLGARSRRRRAAGHAMRALAAEEAQICKICIGAERRSCRAAESLTTGIPRGGQAPSKPGAGGGCWVLEQRGLSNLESPTAGVRQGRGVEEA